jgi:hypothetical protein
VQRAPDGGECDVDDRGVEHHDELRGREKAERDPAPTIGGGGIHLAACSWVAWRLQSEAEFRFGVIYGTVIPFVKRLDHCPD